MLSAKLIAVGNLRESCWQDAQKNYLTRLSPYAKCTVMEVIPEPVTKTVTAASSRSAEAERITRALREDDLPIALAAEGKAMDSMAFAAYIRKLEESGRPVAFIIGGSDGLDASLRARCQAAISLSPLTFPHEMARVMLLEQLYRAMTIIHGKTYHK
jgi:23S rRNA (pseudouridine1915-N3)-methyltransferase